MTPEQKLEAVSEHESMVQELCRDLSDLLEESVISYDFPLYFRLRVSEALKDSISLCDWLDIKSSKSKK